MTRPYYVYQLVDPRDGRPFYVGKGQKHRAWKHLRGKSHNAAVNARVAEIEALGRAVEVEIVRWFDTDGEAIDFECTLICATDGLVNVLAKGWKLTPEQERLRKLAKKQKEFVRLGYAKIDWCKAVIAKYGAPNMKFAWVDKSINHYLDANETVHAVIDQLREYVAKWEEMGIKSA